MCNILILTPGQMPNKKEFETMCHNNWHSYGLVTKIDGKLDITKGVPESGEIDAEAIWKLLERDVEFERYLHVRHNTAGATTLENTHPFEVFYSDKKHVVFMHNGTLYPFKSKKQSPNGTMIDDDDGPSDSYNFTKDVLTELVAGTNFGTGKGDVHHPMFKRILEQFWLANNRGILIVNDQAPLLLGDWKEYKPQGTDFVIKSANLEYFQNVTRGPEFSRREAAKKIQEEAERKAKGSTSTPMVTSLSNFRFEAKHRFYALKDSIVNILSDWNVYDRSGAVSLGFATRDELEELYNSKADCIAVMDWVFSDYAKLYEEFCDLEDDKDKATKKIATMTEELKELRAYVFKEDQKVG